MSVYDEVIKVSGLEKKEGVKDQEFLQQVVDTIDKKIGENKNIWDGFTPETQKWMNSAVEAWDANNSIPLPDGFPSNVKPQPKQDPAPEQPTQQQTEPKKEEKPKRQKKEKGPKKPSMVSTIRRMCCEHEDWNEEKIKQELATLGFKEPSGNTVYLIQRSVKQTIKFLKEVGKMK